MDNLTQRGKIVVNACPMCLEDEETIDHLLLRCNGAVKIWNTVISWFGCNWVFPNQIQNLFMAGQIIQGEGGVGAHLSCSYLAYMEGVEC